MQELSWDKKLSMTVKDYESMKIKSKEEVDRYYRRGFILDWQRDMMYDWLAFDISV